MALGILGIAPPGSGMSAGGSGGRGRLSVSRLIGNGFGDSRSPIGSGAIVGEGIGRPVLDSRPGCPVGVAVVRVIGISSGRSSFGVGKAEPVLGAVESGSVIGPPVGAGVL